MTTENSSLQSTPEPQKSAGPSCAVASGSLLSSEYTREQWLSYRVVTKLLEAGLHNLDEAPAAKVFACMDAEVAVWMDQHAIERGWTPLNRNRVANNSGQTAATNAAK